MELAEKVNKWIAAAERSGECLLWSGCLTPCGYPRINLDGNTNVRAHRVIYQLFNPEQDISGQVVRHSCDNPRCINVAHLEIGNMWDNCHDRDVRGRCGLAKTTPEEVVKIRELHNTGKFTQRELGEQFNLNYRTVSSIVKGRTWRWVQQP